MKLLADWKSEVQASYPMAVFERGEWKGLVRAKAEAEYVGFYNTDTTLAQRSYVAHRSAFAYTLNQWKAAVQKIYPDADFKVVVSSDVHVYVMAYTSGRDIGMWFNTKLASQDSLWHIYTDTGIDEVIFAGQVDA